MFDIFDAKKRYVVPLFQRQYVWNREDHWEPLWEDLRRKFDEKLFGRSGPPHFLGAMVIDQKRFYGNEVPTHLIVDGQQRLTTFQIFLAAFRDICQSQEFNESAEECHRYLENTGKMAQPDTERYKVWPTHLDRDQFKAVVDSRSREELERRFPRIRRKFARYDDPRPSMIECYLFFHEQIVEFLKTDEHETTAAERVDKIFEALRESLQVVTIELEGDDDPQVIFETLNARGAPLLPSDLLRNFIFWRAAQRKEPQERLYQDYWLPFDEGFWRTEEKQGRLLRPRSDIFLQHYLSLRQAKEINIGHLFVEYKDWIKTGKPFETVELELIDLDQQRGYFRKLVEPEPSTRLGQFAVTLKVFEVRTVYPLVLGILERDALPAELDGILTDLESYIVRRAICNLTTKNYNRQFLSLLGRLPKGHLTRALVRTLLLESSAETAVWPRDEVFQEHWLSTPSYQRLGPVKTQHVLRCIEERLRGRKSEIVEIKSDLSVEHVLPNEWIDNWPLPNGRKGIGWLERFDEGADKEDVNASALRDQLLHSFGLNVLRYSSTQPSHSIGTSKTRPIGMRKPSRSVALNYLVLRKRFGLMGSNSD
jgi:hypothetical protein